MNQAKKVTLLVKVGILLVLLSFVGSVVTIDATYSEVGTARVMEKKYDIHFENLTDIVLENENIEIIKKPEICNNDGVSFGILLKNVNAQANFDFNIVNRGNVKAVVKKVKVTGIDKYKDYLDFEVVGVESLQTINVQESIKVSVIVTYKKELLDVNSVLLEIPLENVNILVELEEE